MKVSINREERQEEIPKKGLLSRFSKPEYVTKYVVSLKIELSNEERIVAQKANLLNIEIYIIEKDIEPLMDSFQVTFERMLSHGRQFYHPRQAAQFEEELKTQHLPLMKGLLLQSAKPTTGSDTFEL
jgi:hypothetical protein